MAKKKPATTENNRSQQLAEYLKDHPNAPAKALMELFGISNTLVNQVKKRLRAEGILPPVERPKTTKAAKPAKVKVTPTKAAKPTTASKSLPTADLLREIKTLADRVGGLEAVQGGIEELKFLRS